MEPTPSSSFSELLKQFKKFIFEIFDISRNSDKQSTIEEIKAGIYMKGTSAWVLVFSILIASIGLNTGSTAVVIGAMLISPLMGPILGIGLSLGTNNIDLLKKALTNFGVMVTLSLLTSFLFFSIPLFQNETSELIARTFPDVRDVIIALSGGLALIVALSQKNKSLNTIAGVAIATALMPPLCTAGYGLATAKWHFFRGALFLFTINTIFIASATFIIVRFLKFPYEAYANSKRRKFLSRIITTFAIVILVPSMYMFYQLYKESDFNQKANSLIKKFKTEKGILILDLSTNFSQKKIEFAVVGQNLSKDEILSFEKEMNKMGYEGCQFKIMQNTANIEAIDKIKKIENSFVSNQQLLAKKEVELLEKDREILSLKEKIKQQVKGNNFEETAKEIKALYPEIISLSYSETFKTNFTDTDTIPIYSVKWDQNISKIQKEKIEIQLQNWLQTKTSNTKLILKEE